MDFNSKQVEQLRGNLREYFGEAICAALEDPTVTEIKCSEDGILWFCKHVVGWEDQGIVIPEHSRLVAINQMASLLGKTVNAEFPDLEGELYTGDRISASVPPSSPPCFFIRRHAPEVFSLADYMDKGILEPWQADVIMNHVLKRSNIVFCGATNSGKTTLLNTTLGLLKSSSEHIIIIEDRKEIKCEGRNVSRFYTSSSVSMQQQVKMSMGRHPDRLIIGETRDEAGLYLLDAWQTGHRGGFTTIHANSAAGVFERFAQFCERAGVPPQWRLMQSTIDLIVHMEMTPQGRRVTELMEVNYSNTLDKIPIRLKRLES